ncbi:MAG: DUF262 domain-containing protein [Anaerolineae bacterium]
MAQSAAVTGFEAGLSGDDQIIIALQTMINNGGSASMEEIYRNVEAQMNKHMLSNQGKASLRSFINKTAVEKKFVYPYDENYPRWRITSKGREYIEDIQSSEDVDEEEVLSDDLKKDFEEIDDPYDPTQIRVELTPFTIFQVMRKVNINEINLQPDFQRHIVWDETRQSRLIESILIRIPLPAFYLDAVDDDKWLVVDGLQRLSTLHRFYNKNKLRLRNLEFLHELEGKTFEELPRKFQRQIEETKLNLYIIQPDTPGNVKFTIFYRINTGGLFLTAQEIRHALFQGKATKLLEELADSSEFRKATTNSIRTKRMDDREAILRFLAFYLKPYESYKKPDLHGFLSDAMQNINKLDSSKISELKNLFFETMRKAEAVFGPYAFRKMYGVNGKRLPINQITV